MGSSGQAETDDAGQSGAAVNVYCRRRAVVRAGEAWHHRCNADIGKADIRVETDIQPVRRNLSTPI